ncbi:uncharacterized protein B0H64DRAFT_468519 [Chaetomium fimeti]|uniref:Fucose-specific lectin n=1 Tax=Chaetomium fimeti TaxID=1854472 RepID=A0AAE0LNB6_9PEZI|nr:hypothetical protein B0H64DRAFT_468519 [Chaetomium fimeti]
MEQLAQTDRLANYEIPGGGHGGPNTPAITDGPVLKRGARLVPVPGENKGNSDGPGFEYAEHCYMGDAIALTLSDGRTVTARDHPFTLENELSVTYGQINALAGDFYGTSDPISDGSDDNSQRDRFTRAYMALAGKDSRQPKEAVEILRILQEEVDAVNDALAKHQDPSVAYNSLPDETGTFDRLTSSRSETPKYTDLARINWDHFGADARTAYNAGHSAAIDVAVRGELETAYTMNAFADHYLEDSFSAGHLRVPRRYLHSSDYVSFADLCTKLMHDEDNAIGLTVRNPAGETWTAYGDKRGLDLANDENSKRCSRALQVSVDEIYNAWKTKTTPSKASYGAWTHAPTLESALGPQTLAPLFQGEKRRAVIKNRRAWAFTSNWSFMGTFIECYWWSGWWKYPITMDGPHHTQHGSDIAATATDPTKCKIYCQDTSGVIREYTFDADWKETETTIFSAKLGTPLAVVGWDSGNEVRAYCVSNDGYLGEWCYSSRESSWYAGFLTGSKFGIDDFGDGTRSSAGLAAVSWSDDTGRHIRVYARDPDSGKIQEYRSGNPWTKGSTLPSTATLGSRIAAACWQQDDGIHIRVHYQTSSGTVEEHYLDGSWSMRENSVDALPYDSSIAAVRW